MPTWETLILKLNSGLPPTRAILQALKGYNMPYYIVTNDGTSHTLEIRLADEADVRQFQEHHGRVGFQINSGDVGYTLFAGRMKEVGFGLTQRQNIG